MNNNISVLELSGQQNSHCHLESNHLILKNLKFIRGSKNQIYIQVENEIKKLLDSKKINQFIIQLSSSFTLINYFCTHQYNKNLEDIELIKMGFNVKYKNENLSLDSILELEVHYKSIVKQNLSQFVYY
ncbi:MAG: hypothetical protein COB02_16265 [Candidatus Cloacimonadota bacterium]|nr:MAG: hypothetical protein COB02_16265 [Candidatus Cloacimonadota bacterium]